MERTRSCGSVPSNGSVKISGLWKRSQGLSRFTRPNYRHRVFILTDQALSYYSGTIDRVGQLKGRVSLDAITAVEFVDEEAFNLPHTFQILYHSKKNGSVTLYVTATDSTECSDWVTTLRQACYFNKDMLMHYHPGALLRSRWTCCQQHSKTSLGCRPTYHLLTRSSSRYAQMRKKDTLTNSSHSSAGSSVHHTQRRSIPPEIQADGPTSSAPAANGQGRSNSCFDLTHRQVQSRFEPLPRDSESRCSSQFSHEPSVSMGCITLTRLSLSDSVGTRSPLLSGSTEPEQVEPLGNLSVLRTEPKKRNNRFQVAPENTVMAAHPNFPTSESQPQLTHDPTPLPNKFTHSLHLPQNGYHCLTEPRKGKRARTFMASVSPSVRQGHFSGSLHILPTKPIIEPKISNTDPNTIHV